MAECSRLEPIWVWGLPLMPLTLAGTLERIAELVRERKPSYVITSNLNYAMLSSQRADLREVNARAAMLLADGMPLVLASRLQKTPLPERVAGADLIWKMCEQAARLGHRLFLLGGAAEVSTAASRRLQQLYPGLIIAGTHSPPYRELSESEHAALLDEIRQARADILIVAFGQPKGELWIADNYEKIEVPVSIQVGASLDFVAGKVMRAPRWIQRIGMEWAFRLAQEPRRLLGRYARNGLFLIRMLFSRTRPASASRSS